MTVRRLVSVIMASQFFLLVSCTHIKTQDTEHSCRTFTENPDPEIPEKFAQSLFWKIERNDRPPSYILGTVHVADERVIAMTEHVKEELTGSQRFVMEATPDLHDILLARQMTTRQVDFSLQQELGQALYHKTLKIMQRYAKDKDEVDRMTPWSIYLTMNYPADSGLPLDFRLYHLAKEQGLQLQGLETMVEQLGWFAQLSHEDAMLLLRDSVCHYEILQTQFGEMIQAYIHNNIQALYTVSTQYIPEDDTVYEQLAEWLLFERNQIMLERLQESLKQGNTFIAIGAMHLPGEEGLLSLIHQQGYQLTPLRLN